MSQEDLKNALIEGDFERAQPLIEEWGREVAAALKASSNEAELRRVYADALAKAEQNLYLAGIVRAHIVSDLQSNSASFLYCNTEMEHHHWQLNG